MGTEGPVKWLARNDQYAKAIVQLAGLYVGEVEDGVPVCVEATWDWLEFKGPVVYTISPPEGKITWTGDTHTALFRKTLGLLTETFKEMMVPKQVVALSATVSMTSKKPHFISFTFGDAHAVPAEPTVILAHSVGTLVEIESEFKRLLAVQKKLKGIGYGC